MARPKQDGLLYFSFDTDFFYADKRIKRLHSKYGNDGLILYIYLLTEIYRNGYYISWDEEATEDVAADLHLKEGFIEEVLTFLVRRSILTKVTILAGQDTVITSPGIQKRYQEAVKGRKRQIEVNSEIWILSEKETASCIRVTNNVSFSGKNQSKSEKNQSKSEKNPIKESKGKEINNICAAEPHEKNLNKEAQLRRDFEIIYGIYPKKKGKTVAFAEYKKWVSREGKDISGTRYHLTNKQIYLAVKKYVRQQEEMGQDDLQYWKNFDTLMGRQLLDYVDLGEDRK